MLLSVHARETRFTEVVIGLFSLAISTPVFRTYRPSDTLSAVLPFPNRSYAAPSRGFRSFQRGTPVTLSKLRSGSHPEGVAGMCWAGTDPLK